ncbi:nicotinamide N-methyltransferase [Russula earlei]|uniref:Nicotinamide N-methyltransferase n=1 Tax=Russula earlei TaxID=71964 RepID=A0ACC0U889_9AGAM|nr:nicotinamide N-methyltransferase [Russula earlei]
MSDADGDDDDNDDNDAILALGAIFTEPHRPPSPEPTIAVYDSVVEAPPEHDQPTSSPSPSWTTISVRLVGSHPLWGHHLWNAARSLAVFLQRTPELYVGRTVLELGAGGGLPGLVASKCGARKVVLTDYPDQALLDNLAHNVDRNVEPARRAATCVRGYVWGGPVDPLLGLLAPPQSDTGGGASAAADGARRADADAEENADGGARGGGGGVPSFDLILLSDLIFNHSQHRALLTTCERAIAPAGCVLVFYTHHRPHLARRDMQFFDMAREARWECEKVWADRFPPMFPDDPGEEEVRSTVHGWKLTRACP